MEANNDMMKSRGESKRHKEKLSPGDTVWIEATNIWTNRPMAKLDSKQYGPFEVIKPIGETSYQIKIPETWTIHNVFHSSLLTKHHKPEFDSQKRPAPPPPDIINEEEEYKVEAILKHRKRGRRYWYLVHWKGYDASDNSWIPKRDLIHLEELLTEYKLTKNL